MNPTRPLQPVIPSKNRPFLRRVGHLGPSTMRIVLPPYGPQIQGAGVIRITGILVDKPKAN